MEGAVSDPVYERKVSSEEAREGYLLILKDRLRRFPPLGQRFPLRDGANVRDAAIEAVHCECRGPELPHEHYRLPLPGLEPGAMVRIRQDEGGFEVER